MNPSNRVQDLHELSRNEARRRTFPSVSARSICAKNRRTNAAAPSRVLGNAGADAVGVVDTDGSGAALSELDEQPREAPATMRAAAVETARRRTVTNGRLDRSAQIARPGHPLCGQRAVCAARPGRNAPQAMG